MHYSHLCALYRGAICLNPEHIIYEENSLNMIRRAHHTGEGQCKGTGPCHTNSESAWDEEKGMWTRTARSKKGTAKIKMVHTVEPSVVEISSDEEVHSMEGDSTEEDTTTKDDEQVIVKAKRKRQVVAQRQEADQETLSNVNILNDEKD